MSEPSSLTIVIPTRNRPQLCGALVGFLRRQVIKHRIIIADASDEPERTALRALCGATSEILNFPVASDIFDRLITAVEAAEGSLVVLLPDDDIPLPHALERCFEYLTRHPETTAVQGYVLDLAFRQEIFDITCVRWFTPSIEHEDPLQRLYHLVRRYQPFFWGGFRKDALLVALRQARIQRLVCFQEMAFMAALVVLGKFARLPCVYMLRGVEASLTPLAQTHPFFAFLADSNGFFAHYRRYCDDLAAFIEATVMPSLGPADLRHMLHLIHAICFRPILEGGPTEHTVQVLLDPSFPPMVVPSGVPEFRKIGWRDLTVRSTRPGRSYVWRREVLKAEPREEIVITAAERNRVTAALDDYVPTP